MQGCGLMTMGGKGEGRGRMKLGTGNFRPAEELTLRKLKTF